MWQQLKHIYAVICALFSENQGQIAVEEPECQDCKQGSNICARCHKRCCQKHFDVATGLCDRCSEEEAGRYW